jgi:hypothetical protein
VAFDDVELRMGVDSSAVGSCSTGKGERGEAPVQSMKSGAWGGAHYTGQWRRFLHRFWRGEATPVIGDTESGDGVLSDATCGIGRARGACRAQENRRGGRAPVAFMPRMR